MAIAGYLKQSTAVTIKVGPFVDETDGKTAETGLTISQADVRLSKNGGNMAQKAETTSLTHDEVGMYDCPLDTTDTGTLGILTVNVHESGALPVRLDFMVVPANVWDSLFGSDKLDVNVAEWLGTAPATPTTAGIPEVDLTHIAGSAVSTSSAQLGVNVVQIEGTDATDQIDTRIGAHRALSGLNDLVIQDSTSVGATGNDTTHVHLDSMDTDFADDSLNDYLLVIYDASTDTRHSRWIKDWVATGQLAEVDTLPFTPTSSDFYRVLGFRRNINVQYIENADPSDTIRDAVVDDATRIDASALNTATGTSIPAILVDTGTTLQAELDAIQAAVITNAAGVDIAADIIAIKAETASILTDTAEIGAAGAGLTEAGGTGDHLTAINLPDQTMNITGNITGNLSGSVGSVTGNVGGNVVGSIGSLAAQAKADVNAEADTALSDYDPPTKAELDTAQAAIIDGVLDAVRISKNTQLSNFAFFMRSSTDHVSPKTGLTITSERSIDGGAFASTTNSASEISDGFYKITLSADDLNGDVIALRFSGTGADDTVLTLITQPKD